ncbi:MAG: succinoglycan biosynthesis protein [Bacteroidetes bacterium]|nr:MAG: succinoglycan biosynthesis protein [Bacteroidota bacterium]
MILSIIICTYNRVRLLPYCIDSIFNQNYDKNDIEIIFIDNNSTDGSGDYFKNLMDKDPRFTFKYFLETKQGLSYARNRGIQESIGKYVAFVDDDAIMKEDYFQKISDFIYQHPKCQAFGGIINVHFESTPPRWENKYINTMFGYYYRGNESFIYKNSDYPRGSNMIFLKTLFDEVGIFNPKLGRIKRGLQGNEEKDLFQRIYAKRHIVRYDPNLIVDHIAPPERTEISFVKRQATGTGNSERIRTQELGLFYYIKALILESLKWIATFLLAILYFFKLTPMKGIILIRFRYWISSGLVGKIGVSEI